MTSVPPERDPPGPEVPDVSDPDIRRMVLDHHEPDEAWSVAGILLSVHCRTCYHPWPCPAVRAARQAEEAGR